MKLSLPYDWSSKIVDILYDVVTSYQNIGTVPVLYGEMLLLFHSGHFTLLILTFGTKES